MKDGCLDLRRIIADLRSAVLGIERSIVVLERKSAERTLKKDAGRVTAVKKCRKAGA
jgi:hypothetical protein